MSCRLDLAITHRNPLYGCASREPAWEMATLATQFHPSARLFAKSILGSQPVEYSGDPLQDFTLMRFLDRFVFRNPKKDPGKGRLNTVFSKRNVYKVWPLSQSLSLRFLPAAGLIEVWVQKGTTFAFWQYRFALKVLILGCIDTFGNFD